MRKRLAALAAIAAIAAGVTASSGSAYVCYCNPWAPQPSQGCQILSLVIITNCH